MLAERIWTFCLSSAVVSLCLRLYLLNFSSIWERLFWKCDSPFQQDPKVLLYSLLLRFSCSTYNVGMNFLSTNYLLWTILSLARSDCFYSNRMCHRQARCQDFLWSLTDHILHLLHDGVFILMTKPTDCYKNCCLNHCLLILILNFLSLNHGAKIYILFRISKFFSNFFC